MAAGWCGSLDHGRRAASMVSDDRSRGIEADRRRRLRLRLYIHRVVRRGAVPAARVARLQLALAVPRPRDPSDLPLLLRDARGLALPNTVLLPCDGEGLVAALANS